MWVLKVFSLNLALSLSGFLLLTSYSASSNASVCSEAFDEPHKEAIVAIIKSEAPEAYEYLDPIELTALTGLAGAKYFFDTYGITLVSHLASLLTEPSYTPGPYSFEENKRRSDIIHDFKENFDGPIPFLDHDLDLSQFSQTQQELILERRELMAPGFVAYVKSVVETVNKHQTPKTSWKWIEGDSLGRNFGHSLAVLYKYYNIESSLARLYLTSALTQNNIQMTKHFLPTDSDEEVARFYTHFTNKFAKSQKFSEPIANTNQFIEAYELLGLKTVSELIKQYGKKKAGDSLSLVLVNIITEFKFMMLDKYGEFYEAFPHPYEMELFAEKISNGNSETFVFIVETLKEHYFDFTPAEESKRKINNGAASFFRDAFREVRKTISSRKKRRS